MGKTSKILVCGTKKCGKTSILEQAIYGRIAPLHPTIEDIYTANISTDRGTVERVCFFDTEGIDTQTSTVADLLPRHLVSVADGIIIVYSVDDELSFQSADAIRREWDKQKEKKEFVIVVLGNKSDLAESRQVDAVQALNWAAREKVKLFELQAQPSVQQVIVSPIEPDPQQAGLMPSRGLVLGPSVVRASSEYGCCGGCHLVLHEPFILCQSCVGKVYLCLACFSKGKEFASHESHHAFTIIKNDFSLFEPCWTAQEDLTLLEALLTCGVGNWEDVAKALPCKTAKQCSQHFHKFYVDDATGQLCGLWKQYDAGCLGTYRPFPLIGQQLKLSNHEARRHFLGPSHRHVDSAGYNSCRADFDVELDNQAEAPVSAIDATKSFCQYVLNNAQPFTTADKAVREDADAEEEEELFHALAVGVLAMYHSLLKRRMRRKRLVRELGLLNKVHSVSLKHNYSSLAQEPPKYEALLRFRRLYCALDFDFLLEGLALEMDLRKRILQYQEYRANGLSKLSSTAIFSRLRLKRERSLRQASILSETVGDWKQAEPWRLQYLCDQNLGQVLPFVAASSSRKATGPLDVVGLPGYEKLSSEEVSLCSECRILPTTYLDVKEALVSRCKQNKGLRLADARPLVKIDVNKTRKVYDFLTKCGIIYASPS